MPVPGYHGKLVWPKVVETQAVTLSMLVPVRYLQPVPCPGLIELALHMPDGIMQRYACSVVASMKHVLAHLA